MTCLTQPWQLWGSWGSEYTCTVFQNMDLKCPKYLRSGFWFWNQGKSMTLTLILLLILMQQQYNLPSTTTPMILRLCWYIQGRQLRKIWQINGEIKQKYCVYFCCPEAVTLQPTVKLSSRAAHAKQEVIIWVINWYSLIENEFPTPESEVPPRPQTHMSLWYPLRLWSKAYFGLFVTIIREISVNGIILSVQYKNLNSK